MKNLHSIPALAFAVFLLASHALRAQVPQIINCQGRVAIGAVNFDGTGQFKFALVSTTGTTTFWSNDGTSAAGSQPTASVSLTVTKGLYSVPLGDTGIANMTGIPASVFGNADVRLRVWFNDGVNGSQLLTPDQRISSVGYALMAGNVQDGAITSAKIASGAVGQAQIADGAVTGSKLAPGSVGQMQLAAGAVGANQLANNSIGSAQIADGAITAGKIAPAAVNGDLWTPIGAANAPSTRSFQTAVWTGSEMIIWGGNGAAGSLNDGARYNPALNTWTPVSTTGAPTGRGQHTAVWTGTEMIVWGGLGAAGFLNDGARYNPTSDTWTAITNSGAPAARRYHTAVWTGTEMIVWGGGIGGGIQGVTKLNDGGRYNPSTNTWVATNATGAPSARYIHTAVWTGSEMIVWGGFGVSSFLGDGARYNPALNSWVVTNPSGAPAGRSSHTAVWTGTRMIVFGGSAGGGNNFNDGSRYDPIGNSWAAIATASVVRFDHSAVWTGSEMIVWGGSSGVSYLNTGEHYNPATNRWVALSPFGAPSSTSNTTIWTGSEMIVWGANNSNDGARLRLSNILPASVGSTQIAAPLLLSAAAASGSTLSSTNTATTATGIGVSGDGGNGVGVKGIATHASIFLQPLDTTSSPPANGIGVLGETAYGVGLLGRSLNGDGVGVWGEEPHGYGVVGRATGGGIGVLGQSSSLGWAGWFDGAVSAGSLLVNGETIVKGNLVKASGSFRIDHPLDPANKYLSHSFVESPDMMNIYNGNIVLDAAGEAVVELPEWFDALNKEFRYQLTCLGGFAPVFVSKEISNNRFEIAGGKPGLKVSWQVTGVRQDAWANAHRILTEEEKRGDERGAYLHPELFGQPEAKNINQAHTPEMVRQMIERPAGEPAASEANQ